MEHGAAARLRCLDLMCTNGRITLDQSDIGRYSVDLLPSRCTPIWPVPIRCMIGRPAASACSRPCKSYSRTTAPYLDGVCVRARPLDHVLPVEVADGLIVSCVRRSPMSRRWQAAYGCGCKRFCPLCDLPQAHQIFSCMFRFIQMKVPIPDTRRHLRRLRTPVIIRTLQLAVRTAYAAAGSKVVSSSTWRTQ
ncbi:hypothetical protein BC834DRAFT_208456 [Gloeopeniophorella convolvens]|nr:hypothetical protein BC834DRAFT_208456 [Gloeopeniophorella convolvens]